MTFKQLKNKLDNISEKDHDKVQCILAKICMQNKKNKSISNALELASMALLLYTKGGKNE